MRAAKDGLRASDTAAADNLVGLAPLLLLCRSAPSPSLLLSHSQMSKKASAASSAAAASAPSDDIISKEKGSQKVQSEVSQRASSLCSALLCLASRRSCSFLCVCSFAARC